MFLPKKLSAAVLFAIGILLIPARAISAVPTNEVLTNAADILALPLERASNSISVSITGVVTAAEPNWGGRFFVQDASGGVFVNNTNGHGPSPCDLVSVSGISMPGGYAPCIDAPHWKKLGTAPLPIARVPTIERFMAGNADSQRIEMSGIVRSASTNYDRLCMQLESGAYRYPAYSPIPPGGIDPQALVGARVRVRGTAAVSFNASLRHFLTIVVYAPLVSDFTIEESATGNAFEEPLTPLNGIAQYQNNPSPSGRIHVKGIVTYQRPGEDLFLQDTNSGLQIKSAQAISFAPGDTVEAVGFPGVQNFLPVLEDAVLRKVASPPVHLAPLSVKVEDLQVGLYNASFIRLRGKLLDRLAKSVEPPFHGLNRPKTVLVLQQSTNLVFMAEREAQDSFLTSIPIGSTVDVEGICLLQSTEDAKTKSVQLLLPSSQSVRIISSPSWLTPGRLLMSLAVSFVVILIGSTWIIMVSKRNSALKLLIHERELDRKELQKAHDTLEWRVKDRTRQLKTQITARKEAEVQSKAILSERTRLAKELHDTIEQTMTGVTLQLNAVAKLLQQNPETASHHLGLARSMVRTSRVDLRRSIWDLRSRELEQFDLPTALMISGNQIADGAKIRIEIETKGKVHSLPEIIEENILRVGQEAITNTVKHSGATLLLLGLEFYSKNVILSVKDNGNGFTPENCLGPDQGHFGLLGMSERTKRLGGKISVTSVPGAGTTIRVEIPIEESSMPKLATDPEPSGDQKAYEEIIPDTNSYS